jgi:hypothetical protein
MKGRQGIHHWLFHPSSLIPHPFQGRAGRSRTCPRTAYKTVASPLGIGPFCVSSGGWFRASGLLLFRETLLPSELHRKESETLVGIEPTSCDFADRCLASRPQDHFRSQYDVRESNPSGLLERQATSPEVKRRIKSQSARRESNPPWTGWKPVASPLGHGHVQRKERESNPQGLVTSSRFERGAVA